jgi:hypothetical protein
MTRGSYPVAIVVAVTLCLITACGRKGAPRPAEEVLPEPIADLQAESTPEGIQLTWGRPRRYTGGDRMPDLGGFWIQRASEPGAPFELVGTVEVTDLERFQQAKQFRWVDKAVEAERTYRYRVVSFTLDRYVSAPSNIAVGRSALPEVNGETTESAPE